MKLRKNLILLTLTVSGLLLLFSGWSMAQEACPESCTMNLGTDKRPALVDIDILPRDGVWPVLSSDTDPQYPCPTGVTECLAWPYICSGTDCNNISLLYASIHRCCDNPIRILSTDQNVNIFSCDQTGPNQNQWTTSCNSFTLQIPPDTTSDDRFWFTTQVDVDVDMIDVLVKAGGLTVSCRSGIKGPGCGTEGDRFTGEPVEFTTTVGGVKIKYNTNQRGCANKCQFWNDPARCEDNQGEGCAAPGAPEWVDCLLPDTTPSVEGETIVDSGRIFEPGQQKECKNHKFTTHGSPGWVWSYLNGYYGLTCIGYYYAPLGLCCDGTGCVPKP